MCGRIYIIYLLGSILIFSSCSGRNDETFVNLDISLVNIDGNEYISREKAVLIDNGSVFSTKLFSINGDLSIDLVVYFKNKITDINNSCLQPILICYSQNNKYYQFSIIDGKAIISSASNDSFSLLFEKCEFGENNYISGSFSVCLVSDIPTPSYIAVWGKEHPFKRWINEGTQQWVGTTLLNVQNTGLIIYPSEKNEVPSPAIVICPGGAYSCLEAVHEGRLVAEWFAKHGVTAIVLHYCLPNGHPEIPLSDVQETMRYLRENFATYKIRPDQIGVIGFSAGGHLASLLSTHFDIDEKIGVIYPEKAYKSRPDFTILCYPVITMREPYTHIGTKENLLGADPSDVLIDLCSSEKQVTSYTPPTLLFHASDDYTVPLENSKMYHQRLVREGIKSRLVVFPAGGHGWGFSENYQFEGGLRENILHWLNNEVFVN